MSSIQFRRIPHTGVDSATTGRVLVKPALSAQRRILATRIREANFAALAAQQHIATTPNRLTATERRIFVQRTILTNRGALLTAFFCPFDFAAHPAQGHFVGVIVAMWSASEFFFPTTCHKPQANSGNRAIQVVPGTHSTCFLELDGFYGYRIEVGCKEKESDRNRQASRGLYEAPEPHHDRIKSRIADATEIGPPRGGNRDAIRSASRRRDGV